MLTREQIDKIIESHGKWLRDEEGGSRANLCDADLRGADLRGADLRCADLCGADLRGANLCRADLRDANLCRANLRDANLRDANLCDADLRDANLCGADLRRADLCDANLPKHIIQIGPIGSRRSYTTYNVSDDIVQCGCWNNYKGGSLEMFVARVDDVYPPDSLHGKEYRAAIDLFKAMQAVYRTEDTPAV